MKLGLFVLLAVLVLGAFFLFRVYVAEGTGGVSSPAALSTNRDDSVPAVLTGLEGVSTPESNRDRTSQGSLGTAESVTATEARILRGMVVVRDEAGREYTDLDGQVKLTCQGAQDFASLSVEVTRGAFEIDLEQIALVVESITPNEMNFGGRIARPESGEERIHLGSEPLVLYGLWPRSLFLNVLSAQTGQHLEDVRLLNLGWSFIRDERHPGVFQGAATHLESRRSPVELWPAVEDRQHADVTYLVHSPGYAWKAVDLNVSHGGERELRLDAGGDVVIHVHGEFPEDGVNVWLTAAEDELAYITCRVEEEATLELAGLELGHYYVSAGTGSSSQGSREMAMATVVVKAGARAMLDLHLLPPPVPEAAHISGTLVLPAEWGVDSFRLECVSLSQEPRQKNWLNMQSMEALPGRGDAWTFEFRPMPSGEYRIELSGGPSGKSLNYALYVSLADGERRDFLFEVPPPAEITVGLLSRETGEPLGTDTLTWAAVMPGSTRVGPYNTVKLKSEQDFFEFVAPVGQVMLTAFASSYNNLNEAVDVRSGVNERTFWLDRNCRVLLRFVDGETPVPAPGNWFPSPEHLDGEGELQFISLGSSDGFELALSEPGRYLFNDFPEITGFRPIEDHAVTVERGTEAELLIRLVRQ